MGGPHTNKRQIKSVPPPSWREKWKHMCPTEEMLLARWTALPGYGRWNALRQEKLLEATRQKVQSMVTAGTTNQRFIRAAATGVYRRIHRTDEESALAYTESLRARDLRRQEEWLAFRRKHYTGCIEEGCVFAPSSDPLAPAHTLAVLLEHDHRDRDTKVERLIALKPVDREVEVAKTDCKCIWHHHLRTCDQLGVRGANECTPAKMALARLKDGGCQHPLHRFMPYSSMVPSTVDNALAYPFLHVSHIRRHTTTMSGAEKEALHSDDLAIGRAAIHCKFCHRLYTACEMTALYNGATSRMQYEMLLRYWPSFVQHFEESTAGFDWAAERLRLSVVRSKASKPGNSVNTKRKPDNEPVAPGKRRKGEKQEQIVARNLQQG